jgi:hypothetical protein
MFSHYEMLIMTDINIDRLFYFESNDTKRLVRRCLSILFRMKILNFSFFVVNKNQNLQFSSTVTFARVRYSVIEFLLHIIEPYEFPCNFNRICLYIDTYAAVGTHLLSHRTSSK